MKRAGRLPARGEQNARRLKISWSTPQPDFGQIPAEPLNHLIKPGPA